MGDINSFALQQTEAAAAKVGAFSSAPYPLSNSALIQRHTEQEVTNTAIAFAIHGRRILDNRAAKTKFELDEPFRIWSPARGLTKANLLRDALNRIIHGTEFKVGFEKLPDDARRLRLVQSDSSIFRPEPINGMKRWLTSSRWPHVSFTKSYPN